MEFYEKDGLQEAIDLSPYIDQNVITIVEVNTNEVWNFRNLFDPTYFDRLDQGETESLAYLLGEEETCLFSSGDSIVYKVLGRLHRSDQGISLEEILQKIGFGRELPPQYTKVFRKKWTKRGQRDGITDIGLKKS